MNTLVVDRFPPLSAEVMIRDAKEAAAYESGWITFRVKDSKWEQVISEGSLEHITFAAQQEEAAQRLREKTAIVQIGKPKGDPRLILKGTLLGLDVRAIRITVEETSYPHRTLGRQSLTFIHAKPRTIFVKRRKVICITAA